MRHQLQKYAELDLDSLFETFYDEMLSNQDFSVFFKDEKQIRSLIAKQKQFLLESIVLPEAEVKQRYVALGEMHFEIKVPYVDYMAGMNILERGIIQTVVANDEPNELLEETFFFFSLVRGSTAKGYLNKMLEADITDIDHYLARVRRASEIDTLLATERVIWLKNVIFAIKVENRAAAPSFIMPPEITDAIKAASNGDQDLIDYSLEMSRRMTLNATNVFFFLEKGSYEEVLPLYRELMSIYKLTLMLTNVVTIATSNYLVQSLTKDTLTGLLTRHSFVTILNRELAIAAAGSYPLSFIVFDIDHFKAVNDRYGHAAGDRVLSTLAQATIKMIRATDFAFRMGGRISFSPQGASSSISEEQAESIRKKFESIEFDFDGQRLNVTASFGVVTYNPPFDLTYEKMLETADKRMYVAKKAGRNRVYGSPNADKPTAVPPLDQ